MTWRTPSTAALVAGPDTARAGPAADRQPSAPLGRARHRAARRDWARLLLPPVVAFVFAQVLLCLAAVIDGRAAYYFSPSHWARFDSGIYLSIAAHGYTVSTCSGPQFPPHSVCGSLGWSPLYPWLIAFLGHIGFGLPGAAMTLSWLFAFLTLVAVWVLIGPEWSVGKLSCLALAASFPGMIYYYALFPVSLLTFLTVVCLLLFIRRHFLLAGLVGALCAWAFATGALVAVVLFVAALLVERGPRLWRVVVQSAGVAFSGWLVFLVANRLWSGSWTAYINSQSKYGNSIHDPIATFVSAFTGGTPAKYIIESPNPAYNYLIPRAQTAFVALLVLGLITWTLWRRPVGRTEWVLLAYTVVVWLVPLVDGPALSRYRLEALLVPCVALCARLPRPIQFALVGVSAVLAVGLGTMFTRAQII